MDIVLVFFGCKLYVRDGTPQLVSTGPLRAGTAVHFICTSIVLFSSMETLFVGRFVTTG